MSSNGNGNGDDDDDIDRLVDALRDTNQNLESVSEKLDVLVNSMIRGAEEQIEGEGDASQIDKWDSGRISPGTPQTPEAYVEMRADAAKSEDLAAPKVTGAEIDRVDFYVRVYRMYGEHLQKIFQSLSQSEWEKFVQQLAIGYGAEPELVDILQPGPALFGIEVVDRDVSIFASGTHFNYRLFDGNVWFAQGVKYPAIDNEGVLDALRLATNEETELVFGSVSPREVNRKMARAINDRRGLSLPDRFRFLL